MNLPDDSSGYVAAAYIVFVVLLLVYLAIMAAKLSRVEKQTAELLELSLGQEEAQTPDEAVADRAAAS